MASFRSSFSSCIPPGNSSSVIAFTELASKSTFQSLVMCVCVCISTNTVNAHTCVNIHFERKKCGAGAKCRTELLRILVDCASVRVNIRDVSHC